MMKGAPRTTLNYVLICVVVADVITMCTCMVKLNNGYIENVRSFLYERNQEIYHSRGMNWVLSEDENFLIVELKYGQRGYAPQQQLQM